MNSSDNPFLQKVEPMPPLNDKKNDPEYLPLKMNNSDKTNLLQEVWKLVKNKPVNYQFKDDELIKCGLRMEKFDKVREAISKANKARSNIIIDFFAWIFGQITSFIDTIVKIILVLAICLLSLQLPYLNEQANETLNKSIFEASENYQKYETTIKQLESILAEYKLKEKPKIPAQLEQDKKDAQKWLKYKNTKVETIWAGIPKDWSKARATFDDLFIIYQKTFKNYHFGLPQQKQAYMNAGIISLISLLIYIILQAIFTGIIKNTARKINLKRELRKVL